MNSTPQFNIAQLQAARAKAWHQSGEPLLTLDAVREWITSTGMVLFAPRPQIAAPAPSLVEATLGAANEAPTAAQTDTARSFVARLVSEGNALPLNLLGGPGDTPDFVVSAQMFSFVFTLHGNKLWKQPPSTSGTVKVTPLALGAYDILSERSSMTASDLASELGREITEAAVMRGLSELWSQLRVIPVLQQGGGATQWELTTKRFTKAIKAGANAGQPTALSALASVYLSQALLASEEEIATFLSPLAARSRIREVVHGLSAGRQLEPIVLEGKELLHVPGTLPAFPVIEEPAAVEGEEASETAATAAPEEESRIKRFTTSEERGPRDFKGKPAAGFARGARKPAADRKPFGDRVPRTSRPFGERTDRERRPFKRDAASEGTGAAKSFTRPWSEDRKPRTERPASAEGGEAPAKRPYERSARPAAGGFAKREGYTKRPAAGGERRGPSSDRGPARKSFGDKSPFRKDRGEGFTPRPRSSEGAGERKPYVRRDSAESGGGERPRRTYDRPSGGSGGFAPKRPYVRRDTEGGARPAYGGSNSKPREEAPKRTYTRRDNDSSARPSRSFDRSKSAGGPPRDGAKRPYVRRDDSAGERPARPSFGAKRPYTPRAEGSGDRPSRPSFGSKRPYTPRREGSGERSPRPAFGAKRPYVRREGAEGERPARPAFGVRGPAGDRPSRPFRSGPSDGAKPRSFAPRGDRPSGPPRGRPAGGSFTKREGSRPGGKVPFGGKPGFGKRPASGGDRPTPRKRRPEE